MNGEHRKSDSALICLSRRRIGKRHFNATRVFVSRALIGRIMSRSNEMRRHGFHSIGKPKRPRLVVRRVQKSGQCQESRRRQNRNTLRCVQYSAHLATTTKMGPRNACCPVVRYRHSDRNVERCLCFFGRPPAPPRHRTASVVPRSRAAHRTAPALPPRVRISIAGRAPRSGCEPHTREEAVRVRSADGASFSARLGCGPATPGGRCAPWRRRHVRSLSVRAQSVMKSQAFARRSGKKVRPGSLNRTQSGISRARSCLSLIAALRIPDRSLP